MSEVTTRPAKAATKTPAHKKASPSHAPVEAQNRSAPEVRNSDELTVAQSAIAALKLVEEHHNTNIRPGGVGLIYGYELARLAIKHLEGVGAGEPEFPAAEAFSSAAAISAAALAYDRAEQPSAIERHAMLESVLSTLDSAFLSYGCDLEPCEALAIGIRAGAHLSREQYPPPAPPSVNLHPSAGYRHQADDIELVFETLAAQCEALREFSADIQTRLQDKGSIRQAGNDLTIVQHMAAFMGSICEEIGCGTGNFIGGPASWATKNGIEAIGGAQ